MQVEEAETSLNVGMLFPLEAMPIWSGLTGFLPCQLFLAQGSLSAGGRHP